VGYAGSLKVMGVAYLQGHICITPPIEGEHIDEF